MSVWGDKLLCFLCGRETMHAGVRPWLANFHLAMAGSIRKSRSDGEFLRSLKGCFRAPENRVENWVRGKLVARCVPQRGGNPGSNYLSVASINGSARCRRAITPGCGAVTISGRSALNRSISARSMPYSYGVLKRIVMRASERSRRYAEASVSCRRATSAGSCKPSRFDPPRSYDSRSLVDGEDSEAGQFYRGGMAIAVEAHRAHGNPTNAVQRARVAAAMPATHVLEVARFPHQELEKLSHLRFAQQHARYAVDADAHAPISALLLARHDCELELVAGSHGIPPFVRKIGVQKT